MAFFIGHLEALICLTEKDKCATAGSGVQFSYGFANGLLQQLNIPEMRDAVIELIKSTTETQWKCLLDPGEVKRKLSTANDPKDVIKILTGCLYGIEINVDEVGALFDASWTYVQKNYTDAFFQGQATAFIITIVLPPLVKALQTSKLGQLLKNARTGLLEKLKNTPKLEELEKGLDDVANRIVRNGLRVGDNIAGITIKQIKTGTNGKVAVVGRRMSGHVEEVASALKKNGVEVEIFNKDYQQANIFEIEGQQLKWDDIQSDFNNLGKYKRDVNGYILDSDIPNTLMFKANKRWAEKLINEGYQVIDVGCPTCVTTESTFYSMELSTIF